MNPLKNWTLDPKSIHTVGRDLRRPECILAERNGSLWVADSRGGVMHIHASGEQNLVLPPDASQAGQGVKSGGADLKAAYLGSLKGTSISSFTSPVAGLPMAHW